MYDRSPVHFIDRVRGAVLLLQGLDDPVVPAEQAEMMFAALTRAGVPCAYIGYPGEQHGFREAANIARTLEAQLYFFATVTGMSMSEAIDPVAILNLQEPGNNVQVALVQNRRCRGAKDRRLRIVVSRRGC